MFRIFRIATLATLFGGYEILHMKKMGERLAEFVKSSNTNEYINIRILYEKEEEKEGDN